jgi:hypothetical protein
MPRAETRHGGMAMDTRPRIRTLQALIGGILLLAATTVGSGLSLGTDTDHQPVDPGTTAIWLHDHFVCEHGSQMAELPLLDTATQAAWLRDHFCCEHGIETAGVTTADTAMQAAWLRDHFDCEHGAVTAEMPLMDMATRAAWLHDHFECEHGAEVDA